MATMKLNCNEALQDLLAKRKALRDRELEIAEDRKSVEQRVMAALEGHVETLIKEIDQDGRSLTSSIKLLDEEGNQLGEITGIGYGIKVNQVLAKVFADEFPQVVDSLFKVDYKAQARPVLEQLHEGTPESPMKEALSGVIGYTYSTPRLSVK